MKYQYEIDYPYVVKGKTEPYEEFMIKIRWCDEQRLRQGSSGLYIAHPAKDTDVWHFKSSEDAIMFKLRFGL